MLFKRREPISLKKRLEAIFWPRAGWRRSATYFGHRLSRLPGSPSGIAAGFACGAAISFTPLIGLHFIGAAVLAWALRGNIFASAVGTVVGNPWTFPIIWIWIFNLGKWILGWEAGRELPEEMSFTIIVEHPWEIFLPMLVGGIPTALAAWFAFFFPVKRIVAGYQKARAHRLRRKVEKQIARGERPSVAREGEKADGDLQTEERG
jgi:uncharacterized protein (DUF2062 family)